MRRLTLLLCVSAFALLAFQVSAAAAKSCLGKRATITSNAKKIRGTKAPDVIVGGPGNNRIMGVGGNDRICGGGGNDYINGGRGSDRLSGGKGKDDLFGEKGKEKLFGGGGRDFLRGMRGSDEADGGGGRDRVFGDEGNDVITGGAGARDYVDEGLGDGKVNGGGGGFDIVVGNSGIDRINGGGGPHDIANYATASQGYNIDLGAGRASGDVRERLRGIEDAIGGTGSDTIQGSKAENRLDGGPGDDNLKAAGKGDAAFGGPGSDNCTGGFASENSCGSGGSSPRIVGVELIKSIDDSTSIVIDATDSDDVIVVNRVKGGFRVKSNGQTFVAPGDQQAGNCDRERASGDVVCKGSAGRLVATMKGGNDKLDASDLPRRINSTIDGGGGSDELRGSQGPNTIFSGADNDPDDLIGGSRTDILFGINTENPKRDSGAAVMRGRGGNDLLVGGQPCDGDTFNGGGGGQDSASFARVKNSGIFVVATIGGGVSDPNVGSCNKGKILGSVEKIEGSKGPDRLTGDGSANTLLGRGGNDVLNGRGGRDRCVGGGGSDRTRRCEQSH